MESDSLKLITLLIRRSWLIIIAALLTGGVAYYLRTSEEPTYNAVALISIGDPTSVADPSETLILTGELLAQQYSVIIETERTITAIIDELNLDELDPPISPDRLRDMVSTSTVSDTGFLRINVSSTDAQLAADIANAIARYLDENNISNVETNERAYLDLISEQIDQINEQIDDSGLRIDEIDAELEELTLLAALPTATLVPSPTPTRTPTNTPTPEEPEEDEVTDEVEETPEAEATEEAGDAITVVDASDNDAGDNNQPLSPFGTNIQTRINTLRTERANLVTQRSQDLATLASLRTIQNEYSTRINDVEILDPALTPMAAAGINPIIIAVAGAITGAVLAVAVILFFEFIDTTIRHENEAIEVLGLPILGVINKSRKIRSDFKDYDSSNMVSALMASESYRTIQTNLFLSSSSVDKTNNIYMMVSPNEQEGRTVTIANLAVIAAEAGMKVLLIDADLRDPTLHKIFGAESKWGLATLMALANGQMNFDPSASESESSSRLSGVLKNHIQNTKIPNLKIITSGLSQVEVSAKILGFDSLPKYLDYIQKTIKFDVILIDTPPALGTADSYILAATTKANVIMLIEAGKTSRNAAQRVRDQVLHVGGNLIGVILNKL